VSSNIEYSIDKQLSSLETFYISPIQLGQLCEKFPALQKLWNEFKLIYELCRSKDDTK